MLKPSLELRVCINIQCWYCNIDIVIDRYCKRSIHKDIVSPWKIYPALFSNCKIHFESKLYKQTSQDVADSEWYWWIDSCDRILISISAMHIFKLQTTKSNWACITESKSNLQIQSPVTTWKKCEACFKVYALVMQVVLMVQLIEVSAINV